MAPGVTLSSGCEEETLFALQRAIHGQPVYTDATRLPYASAYFNWLFYSGYAATLRPWIRKDNDAAIPSLARWVSAAGGVAGFLALAGFSRRLLQRKWLYGAAVAAAVFGGPLVGWWAHTSRPDVWGLALETSAVALLLTQSTARPRLALTGVLLLFFAAWSCKQSFVFGFGTSLVFLTVRRRFGAALFLLAGCAALWALTFWLMGPAYRAAQNDLTANSSFYWSAGVSNLIDALKKSFPLLVIAGAGLIPRNRAPAPDSPLARDAILYGTLGLALTVPLCFAASCKLGAYSNYFFTPLLMLAVLGLGLMETRPAPSVQLAGFSLMVLLQLAVLTGRVGRMDLHPLADALAVRWAVWTRQPEPRFSSDTRLNLPWLNPHSPPFVLAFNYQFDRLKGRPFESDGIGGMIARGYFASLLLPAGTREYDGARLHLYQPVATVADMTVYQRIPAAPTPP